MRADLLRREMGLAPGQSPCPVPGCDPLTERELSESEAREHAARCRSEPGCWLSGLIDRVGEDRFRQALDEAEARNP